MVRKRGAGVLLAPLFATVLMASLFIALAPSRAQAGYTNVVEYASNPVYNPGSAYYPCVLYDASKFSGYGSSDYYKMWYVDEGSSPMMKLVGSNDGINWGSPVSLTGISSGGYYATLQYLPSGYGIPGVTYHYKIWYWDSGIVSNIGAIRTADSNDGVNWANDRACAQDPAAPLVTGVAGDWNYHCYGPDDVLYNPSATNTGANPLDYTYAMYYSGASEGLVPGTEEIGLAYSVDGAYWHAYDSNPVLQARTPGAWDGPGGGGNGYVLNASVIRESATMWHMWYSGGQDNWYSGIGYASSADGINWTKSASNPILSPSDGVAWRNARTYAPSVVFSPTHFDGHNPGDTNPASKVWFAGSPTPTSDDAIGYAYIALNQYTIAASADPTGGGTISGAGTYTQVDTVNLAATPNPGWHFVNWTEGGVEVPGAGAVYTFKATADRTLVAHFAPDAYTWYLAEGSTDGGMETWVLVQNPNADPVTVDLTLMTESGPVNPATLQGVTIPALSRTSFNLGAYVTSYDVSTMVVSHGADVVCERSTYGNNHTWGTDSVGATETAATWYLAEGATDGGMETYILVQNPNPAPIHVSLDFLTSTGKVAGPQDFRIPAGSRITFAASDFVTDYDVSTVVTSTGGDIICERSTYGAERTWATGSIGATAPARDWYFAEGSTDGGMETWVLVQNPGTEDVTVDLTLMTNSGKQSPPPCRM